MSFRVRFTLEAKSDLERLYGFLAGHDLESAERALDLIDRAWTILEEFPFSCRKAEDSNAFVREIVISLGSDRPVLWHSSKSRTSKRLPLWLSSISEKTTIVGSGREF